MTLSITDLQKKVEISALLNAPIFSWRSTLARECQVYVFGEGYIAKRFDQINFKFCEKDEAKEIVIDNLYALLRYKYFTSVSEEVDDRIEKIVKNFTQNLKTTLMKVSFDENTDCNIVKFIPDYCIAFRNGVYNFKDDCWLFRYEEYQLEGLANKIYLYSEQYIILWYMNYNFEPLGFKISDLSLGDFIEVMKSSTKANRNYAFELMYNISHDIDDRYSFSRFKHLCEIMGYTCLQSFAQKFVLLIGTGQNGKNSLFDGCFTNRLVPSPASNDLDSLENDRFITGALQNKSLNIFLETSAKTYTESKMLKALTGSMYQTIESKGVSKYSGIINCKYVWAGNDQDKVKFSDTTTGFKRRINMMEIYYRWDEKKKFLKKGDYYDTTFSDSLYEIKSDIANTTVYIYFAMYGIMSATNNFTSNFKFTSNDWNDTYADIDIDLKQKINSVNIGMILNYIKSNQRNYNECEELFYDNEKTKLYKSKTVQPLGCKSYNDMIGFLEDDELRSYYFAENDVYMSVKLLQSICRDLRSPNTFSKDLKKTFNIKSYAMMGANRTYVKVTFFNNKLRILVD